ncbi:MAG TPA: hypothetical protein VF181_01920 [Balneolaceae bacterium]
MEDKRFSLKLGSLLFTLPSIKYITLGLFLAGFLTGITAIIHVEYPEIAASLTVFPVFAAMLLPLYFIIKGVRKAEEVE